MDLGYYFPHAARFAPALSDMQAIIDDDQAALASSLMSFLASETSGPASSDGTFQLPVRDPEMGTESITRKSFSLAEIETDLVAARQLPYLQRAVPSEPQELSVTPAVRLTVNTPRFKADPVHIDLLHNFDKQGLELVVESAATGRERARVQEVDFDTGEIVLEFPDLQDGPVAADGSQVTVAAVWVEDAVAVSMVQIFCAFHAYSTDPDSAHSEVTFNEALYRLLYTPMEEDLQRMGHEEVRQNYLDNPDRIASVSDIQSAFASTVREVIAVDSRITLNRGASLTFDSPYPGLLTGLYTSGRVGEDPGDIVDDLVPSVGAVSVMIEHALSYPETDTEGAISEAFAIVPGVLYAARQIAGVHCTLGLRVLQGIRCADLTCAGDTHVGGALRCARVSVAEDLVARTVSVENDIDAAAGALRVSRDTLRFFGAIVTERLVVGDVDQSERIASLEDTVDRLSRRVEALEGSS